MDKLRALVLLLVQEEEQIDKQSSVISKGSVLIIFSPMLKFDYVAGLDLNLHCTLWVPMCPSWAPVNG